MPFWISSSFTTLAKAWNAGTSKPTKTYYLGLRSDTPTASDTLGAVQEIGRTTPAGYARAAFVPSSIGISNGFITFQTQPAGSSSPSTPYFPVLTGTPSPGVATHWFLCDSPDMSGTLCASGPLNPTGSTRNGNTSAFGYTTGLSSNSGLSQAAGVAATAIVIPASVYSTYPVGAGDGLALDLFQSGSAAPDPNLELVSIKSVGAKTSGRSPTETLTLAAPTGFSHAQGAIFARDYITRAYSLGYQESISLQFRVTLNTGSYLDVFSVTSSSQVPAAPSPPPPPPPPAGPAPLPTGATEVDRVRQWQHLGVNAAGASSVQTSYIGAGGAFAGPALKDSAGKGMDQWVRFRADPRGGKLLLLGSRGLTAGASGASPSGTFVLFLSTDGGLSAAQVISMAASTSLIEVLSERGLVVLMTADSKSPPNISIAQGSYATGALVFGAAAAASLVSSSGSASPLTGILMDMDYDPRTDTLYLVTDSGPLRSKDGGLHWNT